MRDIRWWVLVVLGVVTVLMLSRGTFKAEEDQEDLQTVIGVVSVHERDEEGVALSLFLAGTERGELFVADNGLAQEMKDYIGETVEAEGTLRESEIEGFRYMIYVHDFYVIEEESDDEIEPDEEDDPAGAPVAAERSSYQPQG